MKDSEENYWDLGVAFIKAQPKMFKNATRIPCLEQCICVSTILGTLVGIVSFYKYNPKNALKNAANGFLVSSLVSYSICRYFYTKKRANDIQKLSQEITEDIHDQ